MRNLKYHEQKLLKKVNYGDFKNKREQLVVTKYLLHDRNDYVKYNLIVGKIRRMTESLSRLDYTNINKEYFTKKLLTKLFDMDIIQEKKLSNCMKITVSDFCKRRLAYQVYSKRMVPNLADADKFTQHGHFKVNNIKTKNSAQLLDKHSAEYIRWVDSSKIKKKRDEEKGERDDYERVE